MPPAQIDSTFPESVSAVSLPPPSVSQQHAGENRRFANLRGVQWRINLGIFPSSLASIDDLRRVTADNRRRYAGLRRRLLVDPHIPKDGSNSPDIAIDNPLSQNPDSTWGRFFRNAELEKMVDQDLSRLYREHGCYFQTLGCQGILRRILLLWCLRHPEIGYRQGMHELLAPLLYVLHIDVERLSQVRKVYKDHFTDKFDGLSFQDSDLVYTFDFKKLSDSIEDEIESHGYVTEGMSVEDIDPEIQTIILLSDAYGAEGELGIVLSEKFMEHDAYCMFDALMSGSHGAVAMADFFSPSPASGSHNGLPPVIEASAALYHLLSLVDSSLHSHLVELGVEPQYFSLRWLRVLFGREFSLQDLLVIWDEIFASENKKSDTNDVDDDESSNFWFLLSSRGAFISSIAVSILLYLRSSLLATENATSCLQRLLNFPENVDLKKLIEKAKSLRTLALNSKISSLRPSFRGAYNSSKSIVVRGHAMSYDSVLPSTPLNFVPESYWEDKWRVAHREQELKKGGSKKQNATQKKGWSEKVRFLSRAQSDPNPVKLESGKMVSKSSVRRRLLENLSQALDSEEDAEKLGTEVSDKKENLTTDGEGEKHEGSEDDLGCEKRCFSGNAGSEESSSVLSDPTSPLRGAIDQRNDSGRSSVASNSSIDENDDQSYPVLEDPPLLVAEQIQIVSEKSACNNVSMGNSVNVSETSGCNNDSVGNSVTGTKDRKLLLGKFQWFWKFGRNASGEGTSERGGGVSEAPKFSVSESNQSNNAAGSSTLDGPTCSSVSSSQEDGVDQNVMGTIRNLGQSMLEHIQVLESVFQQDRAALMENLSKNGLVGKGQVTAMTALKELRKISNLLSEM